MRALPHLTLWPRPRQPHAPCHRPRLATLATLAATLGGLGALAAVSTPLARAALPHRADVCDVIRATGQGPGEILAAGPALEAAAGPVGVRGFGFTGTLDGFSYRAITNARASLVVDASAIPGARAALDIVLRPTFGSRDLVVELDGQRLGVWPLARGWQRVSVPLPKRKRTGRLVLTLTDPSRQFEEGLSMPGTVRGLLHALTPTAAPAEDGAASPAPEPALAPPPRQTSTGQPILWLRPGQRVELPVPPAPGLALETRGTRTFGAPRITGASQPPPAPRVRVVLVSPEGAADVAADLPASLSIPWNVDLDRPRVRPYTLRLVAPPDNGGVVGLVAPRLTGPGPVVAAPPKAVAAGRPLVVIAARGVTAEDAAVATPKVPPSVSLSNAWTTSQVPRAAFASVLTGRAPTGHGVNRPRARLPAAVPTLAESFRAAGYRTVLLAGLLPGAPLSAQTGGLARGFNTVRAAAAGDVGPHASDLLAAAGEALRHAGREPTLVVVLLSDAAPPWLPRAAAWRRFAPAGGKPPWPPLRTAERLGRWGAAPPPPKDRPWVRALRRGKIAEIGEAVAEHLVRATDLPLSPVVALVGLGGESPWAQAAPPTPQTARVPVWFWGLRPSPPPPVAGSPAWSGRSADLSDLAPTLCGLVGIPAPAGTQGVDLRQVAPSPAARAFPWAAHTVGARGEVLTVAGDRAVLSGGPGGGARTRDWQRTAPRTVPARPGEPPRLVPGRWTPRPPQAVDPRDPVRRALLRGARTFLAAGPRWSRAAYEPPTWPRAPQGHSALPPVPPPPARPAAPPRDPAPAEPEAPTPPPTPEVR